MLKQLEKVEKSNGSLKTLKKILLNLALNYHEPYLLQSYYFVLWSEKYLGNDWWWVKNAVYYFIVLRKSFISSHNERGKKLWIYKKLSH